MSCAYVDAFLRTTCQPVGRVFRFLEEEVRTYGAA